MPNQSIAIDENKLNQFIGQMLGDLGGASSVAMVRLGGTLGLYEKLHANGPMTSVELAKAAKVHERYVREWLSHQAASNYLAYDGKTQKFSLPPEQAMVFFNENSPVYMMGGFDLILCSSGCRRSTASQRSLNAERRSPMSVAVTAGRPC